MRSVKVHFADGSSLTTSMSADLSDEQVKQYYKVGALFNIGSGAKDRMVKIKKIDLLYKRG